MNQWDRYEGRSELQALHATSRATVEQARTARVYSQEVCAWAEATRRESESLRARDAHLATSPVSPWRRLMSHQSPVAAFRTG